MKPNVGNMIPKESVFKQQLPERTREVEVFDVRSGKSQLVGHIRSLRSDFSAVRLSDGKVLITGGQFHQNTGHHAAEIYNPASGSSTYIGEPRDVSGDPFSKTPYHLAGENMFSRTVRVMNNIVIVGGSAVRIYNEHSLEENRQLENHVLDRLNMPRKNHHLILSGKRLFVVGGDNSRGESTDIEEFTDSQPTK